MKLYEMNYKFSYHTALYAGPDHCPFSNRTHPTATSLNIPTFNLLKIHPKLLKLVTLPAAKL